MDGPGSANNNSSDFVRKLYKMLENPQDESVVRWGNEGDSFVVLENEKFTKHILPKHFKHSNFASFVRQLNKYDFHKVRHNNEDSSQSPYGPGAWEFKHPDFKANNKDALDNIRRKAPSARKPNAGEDVMPTQQMDMFNTQLMATQQQLQQLQERYNELSMHHGLLLQEVIGVQKTVVNHEHVIQYVMNFLQSVDAQRRRESKIAIPFPPANGNPPASAPAVAEDDAPASPLQNAAKLLSEANAENILNSRNLEHMNEMSMRMNAALSTPPPDGAFRNGRLLKSGGAHSATSSTLSYGELDSMVYPVGQTQGIDPMYSEHIHNIPYALPPKNPEPQQPLPEARKKSAGLDPGWARQPHVLLVEDDPTCRRIGSKFLFAFHCNVDSALDGLEAVNKMNAGSKYDLILMDIIMPNLDGVSACHLIRQFDNTPIVAMTSNIRSDDISMYFQHGMNDVLPKPFTKEGLLNMLEKHLGHLKRNAQGMDSMGPPGSLHTSAKHSLKSEDSPSTATSPATVTNWNSPGNITSISSQSGVQGGTDDYSSAGNLPLQAPPPYGLQTNNLPPQVSPQSMTFGTSPQASGMRQQLPGVMPVPLSMPQSSPIQGLPQHSLPQHPGMQHPGMVQQQAMQAPGQPHRRQISDITGGPAEMGPDLKRQQMYAQALPHAMQGRR